MEDYGNALVRCVYCNEVLCPTDIKDDGSCLCGSRKVRVAFAITEEEMEKVKTRGFVYDEAKFSTSREDAWTDEN